MLKPSANAYRRGLTLGLTMAEIFILILFLFLLLLLTLYDGNLENEKTLKEQERILKEIESSLSATENPARTGETGLAPEENNTTPDRNEFPDEITKLVRSNKEKDTRLRHVLLVSKGIDPPCWYKKVPDSPGKDREKPYYLMDIAVHPEHLLVGLRPAPPGRGFELLGEPAITTYKEEYTHLPLAPFPLGSTKKFSLDEFIKESRAIRRRGKEKQVRDYACVFHVAVWDKTPETAKARWKLAEASIKRSFYTYEMKDQPWNHADAGH